VNWRGCLLGWQDWKERDGLGQAVVGGLLIVTWWTVEIVMCALCIGSLYWLLRLASELAR